MSKRFIPYGHQWIDSDDIEEVIKVLKSDFITQGPTVKRFEELLADYTEAKYAVVFSSGTAALHAAYFVAGLKEGDVVLTSPITFVATANAALYLGAGVEFVDVEPDTGNMDVEELLKHMNKKVKLIVPVDYAGHPCDLHEIRKIAREYEVLVVEDASHALGAKYRNQKVGSISDMTVFSFHPVKSITTGEGGAVLTNTEEFYEKLLLFRTHGITKSNFVYEPHGSWYYEMQFLGYNYRMTDIQAALGVSQMKKLDLFISKRRAIVETYNEAFKDNEFFDIPVERDYAESAYHLYPIRLKDKYMGCKKRLFEYLKSIGIGVQVHYIPVYKQPFYQHIGFGASICPVAEDFYKKELSIPVFPAMDDGDIVTVVDGLMKAFRAVCKG